MVSQNGSTSCSPKNSVEREDNSGTESARDIPKGHETTTEQNAHPSRASIDYESIDAPLPVRNPSRLVTTNLDHPSTTTLQQLDEEQQPDPAKEEPVTWRSLPRKDQLVLLTLARLSEPLTQTSLQTYMFYQLRSFDPSLSDAAISMQVGFIQGGFTAAQFLTAMMWGRLADSEWMGRKRVVLIGLLGTAISTVGFGFSRSFAMALCFRCVGGVLNGNVGVMRTMISEIIKEKKYQSRAFLILPMTFNIGVIIGPILGGLLADPVGSYPNLFGPGSVLGGKDGVGWMTKWPYALPNLVSAVFLTAATISLFLGLEETLEVLRYSPDVGLRLGRWIFKSLFRGRLADGYTAVPSDEGAQGTASNSFELQPSPITPTTPGFSSQNRPNTKRQKLPFRKIFTRNVVLTFISHGLMAAHVGTFNSLWFVFLSAPRFDPAHPKPPSLKKQHWPVNFTGGLALPPSRIGVALAVLGTIGITLQLFLYPRVSGKLGTVRSYRYSLVLFPITYLLVPFLVMIPSTSKPPLPVEGVLVWLGLVGVLAVQVMARTFALPCSTILVNNCCPHPSVLGTIHGLGQSVSSGARTIAPVVGGLAFGWGLSIGVVGIAWWGLMVIAILGAVAGTFVRDGSGHEILLPGEKEEDEDE